MIKTITLLNYVGVMSFVVLSYKIIHEVRITDLLKVAIRKNIQHGHASCLKENTANLRTTVPL